MKTFAHFLLGVALLSGCAKSPPSADADTSSMNMALGDTPPIKPDYSDQGKQQAWIEVGKDAIKAKLRDPDSAQWRNVEFHAGGGIPIVCGEVNANNGFGGKSGYERFVAAGDKVDVLESEMQSASDMDGVWDKFCH